MGVWLLHPVLGCHIPHGARAPCHDRVVNRSWTHNQRASRAERLLYAEVTRTGGRLLHAKWRHVVWLVSVGCGRARPWRPASPAGAWQPTVPVRSRARPGLWPGRWTPLARRLNAEKGEVRELGAALRSDEDIFRLQIAVCDVPTGGRVEVRKRRCHVGYPAQSVCWAVVPPQEALLECATGNELLYDRKSLGGVHAFGLGIGEDGVCADDALVIKNLHQKPLGQEVYALVSRHRYDTPLAWRLW
mmetsp:Transcript_21026/g.54183  ORF Transcript_21026/g.54183 Transcript_21026/m.54183 type:complete len:245 (+) Transcript_21026:468-1202(+)